MGACILIIEDERHIADGIKLNLSLQGHTAHIALDGMQGIELWKTLKPDLIVLDIMLPGIDGLSVLQRIRFEDERLPVLILSAKATRADKIKGFSFGVDDYLAKPFSLEEFLLRVERLLQRAAWNREQLSPDRAALKAYRFGDNRIDFETGSAVCGDEKRQLTPQELMLLKIFIGNAGKPLSRDKLLEIGWGYTRKVSTRTVDNFVMRLRRYFEKNPKKPVFFKSLRAVGYLFENPDDAGVA